MRNPAPGTSSRFEIIQPARTEPLDELAEEVARGLRSRPKRIPCRFFYDAVGSRIFEEICDLPEYYLTRAEDEILASRAAEIAALVPAGAELVELGSGSARKTSRLIRAMLQRSGRLRYVPIDISRAALEASADRLLETHQGLSIRAIAAEYVEGLDALGDTAAPARLVLFLGSNVGNLDRSGAAAFLRRIARRLSTEDRLVLGVDLRKGKDVLERAYGDARGVTARFNRNLLARLNAELGADFDAESFRHVSFYLEDEGRIEMHLESPSACRVRIARLGMEVELEAGERIHTEDSYKYSAAEIEALAAAAGLAVLEAWSDRERRFRVNVLGRRE
jgi:dimethylhistidine N-methyltransferase